MPSALISNPQARLNSLTNTQGLPQKRLLYCLRRVQACTSLVDKLAQWSGMMNQLADTEYSAYVGIDWAAAKHDICVQAADGGRREFACISSQPEGIDAWADESVAIQDQNQRPQSDKR